MLDIRNLEVTYDVDQREIKALRSLSMHIGRAEYVAVLGSNGSGKSTLVKAICGLVPARAGELKFSGKDIGPGKFGEELFGKVAAVFQEPGGQFLMPTVEREIGSVLQNLGLSKQKQEERLKQITGSFSLQGLLPENPRSLSGGQMQLVNLACALAVEPEMIILDEPTTFLDSHYRNLLLEHIDSLHESGLTVLHVTQYPDEALRAGRVIILESGQIMADGKPEGLLADNDLLAKTRLAMPRRLACRKWLGFDYVSQKPEAHDHRREIRDTDLVEIKNDGERIEPFLSLKDVKFTYGKDKFSLGIDNLRLFRDEFAGLIGPAGSGKSTLAFLMASLLEPERGDIFIDGARASDLAVNEKRKRIGIAWQMPDPAFIGPTVADEIEMAAKNLLPGGVDIDQVLSSSGLSGSNDRIVDTLSGGEKRKLSLACALIGDPDYLILDEPSAFLDPASQLDMKETILRLAGSGKGGFIIGQDIPFISELADRVIGLREGRIIFDVGAEQFFSEPAHLAMLGLPGEPLMAFRKRLVEKGVKIPFGSLDPARLAGFMKEAGIRWQEFA